MNVTCKDRERIFEDGTAAEWAALAAHAAACATCTEEIRTWQSLSVAAKELRDYSPIPGLWSRIERALIEQDGRKARRPEGKWWFSFLPKDRKSTRLNSSHVAISYAVFCLKKQR